MGRSMVQVSVDSLEEEILARVAAVDVGKDAGVVCMRTPHGSESGKRVSTVWTVSSRTRMILELADRMAGEGVERVVMEATSDIRGVNARKADMVRVAPWRTRP